MIFLKNQSAYPSLSSVMSIFHHSFIYLAVRLTDYTPPAEMSTFIAICTEFARLMMVKRSGR